MGHYAVCFDDGQILFLESDEFKDDNCFDTFQEAKAELIKQLEKDIADKKAILAETKKMKPF